MLILLLVLALASAGQETPVELGKKLLQAREWNKALEAFQQAIEIDPENGEAHYYAAQLYALRGDEVNTIGHFRDALRMLPNQQIIWSEYGKWLLGNSYFDEAEKIFGRLVEISPEDPNVWRDLGLALYQNGKPEEALPAYGKAIELDPTVPQSFYLAGVAARSVSRLSEAKEYFKKGLALNPKHPELNFQMGEMLIQDDAFQEALTYLKKLDETHIPGDYARGVAYLRLNQLDQAEHFLLEVVKANPSHTQAHYQLGRLYARKGEKELSEQFFQRFRTLEEQDRERSRISQKKTIVERNPG